MPIKLLLPCRVIIIASGNLYVAIIRGPVLLFPCWLSNLTYQKLKFYISFFTEDCPQFSSNLCSFFLWYFLSFLLQPAVSMNSSWFSLVSGNVLSTESVEMSEHVKFLFARQANKKIPQASWCSLNTNNVMERMAGDHFNLNYKISLL